MCCMCENVRIKVDMQEKGEDRFTGALDQKYTKNMRECGFRLNGTMFLCSQRDRFKTRCYVEQCCFCDGNHSWIQDHGTSFGREKWSFSELFCRVDVYEVTNKSRIVTLPRPLDLSRC